MFHGWHHINFVFKRSKIFAQDLGADVFLAQSAALVHDLNYFVKETHAKYGAEFRKDVLKKCGYSDSEMEIIEEIILSEEIEDRKVDSVLSLEAQAFSDADTLFKALPFTPILFASKHIEENNQNIRELAEQIVSQQKNLLEGGVYFYSDLAKEKYSHWAKINIELWKNVLLSLEDEDMVEILKISKDLGIMDVLE